jgi:hypothetical protein
MRYFIFALGDDSVAGVVAIIAALIALIIWDYSRVKGSSRKSVYLPLVQMVAIAAVFLSVLLMTSRFVAVWFL